MNTKVFKILIISLLFCICVATIYGAKINKLEYETNDFNKIIEITTNKSLKLQSSKIKKKTQNKKIKWKTGYLKTNTKMMKENKTIKTIVFNTKVKYVKHNKKWALVKYKGKKGYILNKRIAKKPVKSTTYNTPHSKLMSYMSYRAITNTSSNQYKLQQIAYTGKYGIRQVNGRYCIAVGSYYTTRIGTYIDLILKNGAIIPCILADCKANQHTDSRNILTYDGSLAEFVVDMNSLVYSARYSGDIHNACNKWKSDIVKIKIYKKVEKF